MSAKYRLVTRSDFDALICAVLLKELDLINEIKFVHPKDMQDGKIEITENDIVTNLPYVEGAHLVFDHHESEILRFSGNRPENYIIDPDAPSATRVVYNYYGGKTVFPNISEEMLDAVDKADSAQFSRNEIMFPDAWVLLHFLIDPRTGLERCKKFRISNYELMINLVDYCKTHSIDEILELPDIKERMELFFAHQREALVQIEKNAKVYKNVVVLDLRQQKEIFVTNRFIIYAMYPESNISIHILWGLHQQNTVFAVGRSIIDRSSNTNIGELMLKYGGGGHQTAGTCQVPNDQADEVLQALIEAINEDG